MNNAISTDGKMSVGVLFRQIKEAHKRKLLHEYKFHDSPYDNHNPACTIAVTIQFLNTTSEAQRTQVMHYIRNNFRVLQISQPTRSPTVATIYLHLVADPSAQCNFLPMTPSCSLEAIIVQLRVAKSRRLISDYEVTQKTIRVTFLHNTPDKTRIKLVGHIYRRYGLTTHMTPDFNQAVIHLYYR